MKTIPIIIKLRLSFTSVLWSAVNESNTFSSITPNPYHDLTFPHYQILHIQTFLCRNTRITAHTRKKAPKDKKTFRLIKNETNRSTVTDAPDSSVSMKRRAKLKLRPPFLSVIRLLLSFISCHHGHKKAKYRCPGKKLMPFHKSPPPFLFHRKVYLISSFKSFVVLFSPNTIVDALCSSADAEGDRTPKSPSTINPELNPTIVL